MRTIEQDKKSSSNSLRQSAMHDAVESLAVGQSVKLYGGNTIVEIVSLSPKTAIVRFESGAFQRAFRKNLTQVSWRHELSWVESLLAAQRRFSAKNLESAIRAN
jgi:hypothetical protein